MSIPPGIKSERGKNGKKKEQWREGQNSRAKLKGENEKKKAGIKSGKGHMFWDLLKVWLYSKLKFKTRPKLTR